MNTVLGSIFGSSSNADRFLTEINAIKKDIQNLQFELTSMANLLIGKMNYGKLKKDIDDFAVYINQFAGVYNDLCFMQELSKNDAELTEIFANDIYFGDDKNLWINGKTLYNATIELGNRLVLVLQGGYNIFGAYDKMEKYKNHCEHQGYAERNAFREKIIKIYSQFNTMCVAACAIIRDINNGSTAKTRFVWAKEGSFVKLTPQSPPTGDASSIILCSFLLLISIGIIVFIYKNKQSISE